METTLHSHNIAQASTDITFAMIVISQFLNSHCQDHWNAGIQMYYNKALGKDHIYEDKGNTQCWVL